MTTEEKRSATIRTRWSITTKEPVFENVRPMLEPPLEITRSFLRGLCMVDETVIVHETPSARGKRSSRARRESE